MFLINLLTIIIQIPDKVVKTAFPSNTSIMFVLCHVLFLDKFKYNTVIKIMNASRHCYENVTPFPCLSKIFDPISILTNTSFEIEKSYANGKCFVKLHILCCLT